MKCVSIRSIITSKCHRYYQQNLLCTISPSVPNVSYFHGTSPTSSTSTPEKRVKLTERSNTEDSGSSTSPDDSHPPSPAEKLNKCSSTLGAVVSQTMSVTSILKTSTRNNDRPKIEMENVELGEGSIVNETTENQSTTIVETTTTTTCKDALHLERAFPATLSYLSYTQS